jgi:alpha-D-xyloside xylohydrolase
MKFQNGEWLLKKGVDVKAPAEVRDVVIDEMYIEVFGSSRPIRTRGDTLSNTVITANFSAPSEDIIRVKIYCHKGLKKKTPEFQINETQGYEPIIKNEEKEVILKSGNLSVKINKDPENWGVDYFYNDKCITKSGRKGMGFLTTDYEKGPSYMKEELGLSVGENVYGLGERFTPFVKNGQVVEIWNEDGGTSSEQTYKNIPFYITNKGYGVFVNHPEKVSFEVASEKVSKVQFSVEGHYLEYFIIGGDSLKSVLSNFTKLTGKPTLPPAWSFGLWLTTSFTTSYDEKTVNSFIDGMIDRDIPLHVFHFDCFWMKEFQWCDFEWDKDVFPEPKAMLTRLKNDKNLKICLWINPYIAQKSKLFDEGAENGYLLKRENGDVWQWDDWQSGIGFVDFTNPDAVNWYKSKLQALIDMGVDAFKTDFGERIPTDAVYFDGSDPMKMHNYYTYLYNKVVFELLEENYGKKNACLFARSATAGGQQFPVHWGGDCFATYESMAESLRGGLSLGLCGFGYWSHDIGGFESTATPDLYKRWSAFGLLSSHSRLHGSWTYRVPWLFDEEAVDVLRFFTKLKCIIMPYIFSQANVASSEGIPVMRAMVLEFPEDKTCSYLDTQFMLGDSILVSPIFNKDSISNYYLPKGKWTNFISGEVFEGGEWRYEKHSYMSIPMLVKENSIIPVGSVNNKPDYDYEDNIEFHLFELKDGIETTCEVFDIDLNKKITVKVIKNDNNIKVEADNITKPWNIVLRGISKIEKADIGDIVNIKTGIKIKLNNTKVVNISL